MSQQVFTLLQVSRSIQKSLSERYTQTYWIQAEMNKLNFYQYSGHCYPELVEKVDGKIVAQFKATLWRADYQRINFAFMRTLREPLKDGIKILFQAKITYDPLHGLSLAILDIDPNYTLGDLEREKQESIKQLQQLGIWDLNREKKLPLLLQRLAIISVETSKGFVDFTQVLQGYRSEFTTQWQLFPALLQGDKAAQDIKRQLLRIQKLQHHFDAVAIIRGGGGDVGLSCYNSFELAQVIAEFPLPVWTGIGHATNTTVAEMIAHTHAITPTQLAEKLAQHNRSFSNQLTELADKIHQKSKRLLELNLQLLQQTVPQVQRLSQQLLRQEDFLIRGTQNELIRLANTQINQANRTLQHQQFSIQRWGSQQLNRTEKQWQQYALRLHEKSHQLMREKQTDLEKIRWMLPTLTKTLLKENTHQIEQMQQQLQHLDPQLILQRGYSITLYNGKTLNASNQVQSGDRITTWLAQGKIESIIEKTTL